MEIIQQNSDAITSINKKNKLNIVSFNRAQACKQFLDDNERKIHMLLNAHRTVNLSPTTIPTLLANGNGVVVEDSSQFQQIINERKCKWLFKL